MVYDVRKKLIKNKRLPRLTKGRLLLSKVKEKSKILFLLQVFFGYMTPCVSTRNTLLMLYAMD